jgi:hypothetical protein
VYNFRKTMARKRQPPPVELYARLGLDIAPWVRKGKFKLAIAHCEAALASLPATDYHKAAARSWLPQTEEAARWLADFYRKARRKLQPRAIYCEMSSFEINPGGWYVDGFATTPCWSKTRRISKTWSQSIV